MGAGVTPASQAMTTAEYRRRMAERRTRGAKRPAGPRRPKRPAPPIVARVTQHVGEAVLRIDGLHLKSHRNMRLNWRARAPVERLHRALGRALAPSLAASGIVRLDGYSLVGRGKRPTVKPDTTLLARAVEVTFVRIGKRKLDKEDNLREALKNLKDGVADALGVDDADARITWSYAPQLLGDYAVEIVVAEIKKGRRTKRCSS